MRVTAGHRHDGSRVRRCGMQQGDRVALGDPDHRQNHDHHAGQNRSGEERPARHLGDGAHAAQRNQRRSPISGDAEDADKDSVVRQFRLAHDIGDRRGGEREHGRVPDHVLDPLQPDGDKAPAGTERLLHPGVDAAALLAEGAAEFGRDQRGGNEKDERGEGDIDEQRQLLLRHHRQTAQADDGRRRHHRDAEGGNGR